MFVMKYKHLLDICYKNTPLFCYFKGKKQAEATGKRLAELQLPYSLIVRSTMARATETSKIIEKSLANVPVEEDSLLVEGAPIPPEPPIGHWRSEKHVSAIIY